MVDRYFGDLYENYKHSKKCLVRQARDLLVCEYRGSLQRFESEFCIPAAKLLQHLKVKIISCTQFKTTTTKLVIISTNFAQFQLRRKFYVTLIDGLQMSIFNSYDHVENRCNRMFVFCCMCVTFPIYAIYLFA